MVFCLAEGMKWTTHKQVNLEKLGEISPGKDENPTLVLTRLSQALQQCTNWTVPQGRSGPGLPWISRSAPGVDTNFQNQNKALQHLPWASSVPCLYRTSNRGEARRRQTPKEPKEPSNSLPGPFQGCQRENPHRLGDCNRPRAACFGCDKPGHWSTSCPEANGTLEKQRPQSRRRRGHCQRTKGSTPFPSS